MHQKIKELQQDSEINQREEIESRATPIKSQNKSPMQNSTKLNDRVEEPEIKQPVNDQNEHPVKTPQQTIIELKKRMKRDEESRKKWQEVVKKKDETIKELKNQIINLEGQVKDENSDKKRISTSISQKDNRITALTNKLKETQNNEKQMKKKLKEYEKNIEELEAANKKAGKSIKKSQPKKENSDAPKLFGANEDDIYVPPLPKKQSHPSQPQHIPQPHTQFFGAGKDEFGHEDIPPARHLLANKETPSAPKEESKQVRFGENLNLHEDSSASSLGDEDVQPVKAQPFLFGDSEDMNSMNFPTDNHLQSHINI